MAVQIITHSSERLPDSERDKQKKNKRHIFAPTAGARSSISLPH